MIDMSAYVLCVSTNSPSDFDGTTTYTESAAKTRCVPRSPISFAPKSDVLSISTIKPKWKAGSDMTQPLICDHTLAISSLATIQLYSMVSPPSQATNSKFVSIMTGLPGDSISGRVGNIVLHLRSIS